MKLSEIIESAALKTLTAVDLPGLGSNQHELNSGPTLRRHFGIEAKNTAPVSWILMAEDDEPETDEGTVTFYDAREAHPTRTEWRGYYTGEFLSRAKPGDGLLLARLSDREGFVAIILPEGSTASNAARILFGINAPEKEFELFDSAAGSATEVRFLERRIIEALGLVPPEGTEPAMEELVVKRFGQTFPTTAEMSDFAREVTKGCEDDPDKALIRWLETEEGLFRALEKTIVQEKLDAGFASVDEFVSYSLSVQNRRKSRMGHALQNHLHHLLEASGLAFSAQATTERSNRPDFLFPSEAAYHDSDFDEKRLFLLAAKSSAKDRWRQILTEADLIPVKHLCTVQPAISVSQTSEMAAQQVVLVLPSPIRATYSPEQQKQSLALGEFIELVSASQHGVRPR